MTFPDQYKCSVCYKSHLVITPIKNNCWRYLWKKNAMQAKSSVLNHFNVKIIFFQMPLNRNAFSRGKGCWGKEEGECITMCSNISSGKYLHTLSFLWHCPNAGFLFRKAPPRDPSVLPVNLQHASYLLSKSCFSLGCFCDLSHWINFTTVET